MGAYYCSCLCVFGTFINKQQLGASFRFPSIWQGSKATASLWVKLYPVLFVFRVLALSLLIIAAARPQTVDVSTRTKTNKGIVVRWP